MPVRRGGSSCSIVISCLVAGVCGAPWFCTPAEAAGKLTCVAWLLPVVLQVVYEDGDVASMWMGVERTRLLITAGEELQRPNAAALQRLATRCAERVGKHSWQQLTVADIIVQHHAPASMLTERGTRYLSGLCAHAQPSASSQQTRQAVDQCQPSQDGARAAAYNALVCCSSPGNRKLGQYPQRGCCWCTAAAGTWSRHSWWGSLWQRKARARPAAMTQR